MRKLFIFALVAMLTIAMVGGVAQAKGKPADKGNPPQKKEVPEVAYVFEGTVASVDELNRTVTVEVEKANKFANSYLESQGTTQATIAVDDDATKITKNDAPAALGEIASGDEIVVKDKALKGATSFIADMVVANTPVVEPVL